MFLGLGKPLKDRAHALYARDPGLVLPVLLIKLHTVSLFSLPPTFFTDFLFSVNSIFSFS